jgi:hypothetical protein
VSDFDAKPAVLDAFGVTQEEIDALPWARAEERARAEAQAEFEHFRDVIVPERVQAYIDEANQSLPEGLHFEWSETEEA